MKNSHGIIITGPQFNALQVAKAIKDVRYYLNGIHIDLDADRIESTNGHRLLRVNNVSGINEHTKKFIFSTKQKATLKVKNVKITCDLDGSCFDEKQIKITFLDVKGVEILSFYPETLDGVFPKSDRIFHNLGDLHLVEQKEIGLNPLYLHDVMKALHPKSKFNVCKLSFFSSCIKVDVGVDDVEYCVMSARV